MSVSLRAICLITCFGCAVSLGYEKSPESAKMMMAREELIRSLMLDKEVMAVVEKEAMMHAHQRNPLCHFGQILTTVIGLSI